MAWLDLKLPVKYVVPSLKMIILLIGVLWQNLCPCHFLEQTWCNVLNSAVKVDVHQMINLIGIWEECMGFWTGSSLDNVRWCSPDNVTKAGGEGDWRTQLNLKRLQSQRAITTGKISFSAIIGVGIWYQKCHIIPCVWIYIQISNLWIHLNFYLQALMHWCSYY